MGDPYDGIDRFGRILAMRWQAGSTDLDWTHYTYDRNGNRKTKDVLTPGAPATGGNQMDELYVYDKLDRLVEARRGTLSGATMPSVSWLGGWKLDALGNVKQYLKVSNPTAGDTNFDGNIDFADLLAAQQGYTNGGNGTWGLGDFNGDGVVGFDDLLIVFQLYDTGGYEAAEYQARTHNYQNQITWMDLNDNDSVDGGESPVYDAEGNNTEDGQGQTLVYDAWNRMVAIKDGSTVKIAYEYDGLFRRIQETVGTTVHSQYYSASWQVIEDRIRPAGSTTAAISTGRETRSARPPMLIRDVGQLRLERVDHGYTGVCLVVGQVLGEQRLHPSCGAGGEEHGIPV